MAYTIEFAESVSEQLRMLTARQRVMIFEAIETQLKHEPLRETRNRKPMRPNPLASWELRVENLRIYYEVTPQQPDVVHILAVGEKRGNRVFIGGKEIQL